MATCQEEQAPNGGTTTAKYALLRRRSSVASLASYIHAAVSMVSAAEARGFRGYVDWRDHPARLYADEKAATKLGRNTWEWYFEQPLITIDALPEGNSCEVWVYEDFSWNVGGNFMLPWNASRPVDVHKLQSTLPKYLRWNKDIQHGADALFAKYGLDPRVTLAISHRGTDKNKEARIVPIESYFGLIDNIIFNQPNLKIWAQPEERAVANVLSRRYGSRIIIMSEFHAADTSAMSDRSNPKSGYLKGLDAVVLMVMFSMCAYLVKNSSNLSDLSAGLSRSKVFSMLSSQANIAASGDQVFIEWIPLP